jgi:hypothetical protein
MNFLEMSRNANNFLILLAATLFFGMLSGCKDNYEGRLLSAIDDKQVYDDKTGRYQSISFLTQSYLDYDTYETFVLPIDKSELAYAIHAPGVQPTQNAKNWGGTRAGNDFVWDRHWKTPIRFKVWWERVVDMEIFEKSGPYDKYTSKNAAPGTAWCEAIITIEKPIPKEPGYFVLHFYPDGHVESYISELKELEAEEPRVKFEDRLKLPVLKGKPCLKEISNPYFGLPRPIPMN